ncbi:MAG: hypothetical protein JWO42_1069 [Chloroflexi bacterium]|nr:hypothetical protein [Chloroflexota bacterium]
MFGFRSRSRLSRSTAALRLGIAALLVLAFSVGLAPAAQARASHDNEGHHHARYYLALGASFAFGYQKAKLNAELAAGTYNPASFNTGYVDDFAHRLADDDSHLQTVNYSCPAETTQSFINGGCPFHLSGLSLHNDYPTTTSQLSVAVAFLNSHPHQVRTITISLTDLAGNALSALYFGTCQGQTPARPQDLACLVAALPAFFAQTQAGADQILTALQAASPSSQILVLQEFDPLMLALPQSVAPFQQMNAILATVATAHGVVLADGITPFTPANLCTLTAVCTPPLYDIHPTDAGYLVLAQALWAAYDD